MQVRRGQFRFSQNRCIHWMSDQNRWSSRWDQAHLVRPEGFGPPILGSVDTPAAINWGFIAMDSPHLMKIVPFSSWVFNATSTSVRASFLLSLAQLVELGTCLERFVGLGHSFNGETVVAVSESTVLHQRREITTRQAGDSWRLK